MSLRRYEFNFWPSFADILISLILMLFIFFIIITTGLIKSQNVMMMQKNLVNAIAKTSNVKNIDRDKIKEKESDNKFELYKLLINGAEVVFLNEPTGIQKIRFSEHVLFPKDEYNLNDKGKKILEMVGNVIKDNINNIREIQIQGHADPDVTKKHRSNLNLASQRAMSVFNYLNSVGIDPVKYLMSATSFGEYKPVQRENEKSFSESDLELANKDEESKRINRRIELLLFYKY